MDIEEENPKKQKKQAHGRRKVGDWVEGVPDSHDEKDDDEEFRLARRQTREDVRKEMRERNIMEKSAFDQLDKFIPCQRDLDLLAEMVVSPLMSESSKWRSFHNEAPNWLKQLVLKREMPKGQTRKAWQEVATTPPHVLDWPEGPIRKSPGGVPEDCEAVPEDARRQASPLGNAGL